MQGVECKIRKGLGVRSARGWSVKYARGGV